MKQEYQQKEKPNNHTIFILSHNSPDKCTTLDTILKYKYTGDYYLIIDNEDKYIAKYRSLYKNHLIIFNKEYFKYNFDSGLANDKIPNCALFARNAVEVIAKELNLTHFIVMDDDIKDFAWRKPDEEHKTLKSIKITDFNSVLDAYCNYTLNANLACTSFGSQNFYIGGYDSFTSGSVLKRRCVSNIMIRNTAIEMKWSMAMYEDFITSIKYNVTGNVVMSLPQIQFSAEPQYTQAKYKNSGEAGNIELYKQLNQFERVIMPIIVFPVSIKSCQFKSSIIPKVVNYDLVYPKIVSSKFRCAD